VGWPVAQPDAAGEIGLGVKVDKEDLAAGERDGGREVDGGGGFADATLLVRHGNDLGHGVRYIGRLT
jgi:hypothetical protein